MKEYVLVVIKPDGMAKALAGQVLSMFLQTELQLIAAQAITVSREMAEQHYAPLKDEPHFQRAVDFLSGNGDSNKKVLAFIFAGKNAVKQARELAGKTNPEEADPKSIRGAFGRITTKGIYENVVHVSATPKEAEQEIKLWFDPGSLEEDSYPTKQVVVNNYIKKIWEQ
jgi:nucleoside-diphosphate kinase